MNQINLAQGENLMKTWDITKQGKVVNSLTVTDKRLILSSSKKGMLTTDEMYIQDVKSVKCEQAMRSPAPGFLLVLFGFIVMWSSSVSSAFLIMGACGVFLGIFLLAILSLCPYYRLEIITKDPDSVSMKIELAINLFRQRKRRFIRADKEQLSEVFLALGAYIEELQQ